MSHLLAISGEISQSIEGMWLYNDQKESHIYLRHPSRPPLVVPNHKNVARGTLRAIVRDAELKLKNS